MTTDPNARPVFLDVESSLTGRRWVGPTASEARAAATSHQHHNLHPLVCAILADRGIPPEMTQDFLNPTLRALMPDPDTLKDMKTAAERLVAAVQAKEPIAIFADYDVDGGTSAALLVAWLRSFAQGAKIYVPDRIKEGYGPNTPAMEMLAKDHRLIICVDCGTLSHDPIAAARKIGADVLVIDHHMGGENLPDANAVVNPNRQDEETPLTYLCAAGVVFLLLISANRMMRESGKTVPDLLPLLDLVALATVADVAPLTGLNRALVRQGLKIMALRERIGLVALADAAGMTSAPTSYHLGYLLGPRINAGGRIGAPDLGARLLASDDPAQARDMAEKLDALNVERRAIEAKVQEEAMAQAEARGFDAPLVWAAGEGWHPGVVGIVASRLKEAANRPAIVIGFDNGDGKGSGRSVRGIDLGAGIASLSHEELIERGGGHKMAAGLSLTHAQLEPAMARLAELLSMQGAHLLGPKDLRLQGIVATQGATLELVEAINQAGPFGASAPAPRIAIPAANIAFAKRSGETHLSLSLKSSEGPPLAAIAFGAFDSALGQALLDHKGQPFHIAGRLEIDDWGGRRRAKLRVEDAQPA